jgi:hypothetical protein
LSVATTIISLGTKLKLVVILVLVFRSMGLQKEKSMVWGLKESGHGSGMRRRENSSPILGIELR